METCGCRLLIVDDEEDFAAVLRKRLTRREVDVTVAHSGEEALAAVSAGGFDIVLLDVKMPGMDGIATLREIKALAPAVEVIMLTGHASVPAAMEGMTSGAFDYLVKPVDFGDLVLKLQDAYRRRELRCGRQTHDASDPRQRG
ncbi:DNA-binding NtrC family response regulator [Desulfobaculum xiamenense]|uniref:DNA-binding NtrC family response regulator n=1 Tax=Desulfobaculum xiamenense TaxID=995050 RepID=A0A846QPA6_9BACT|nr:response regulator [Desulfobaculum xiamenense]NJB68840.1 DNA-binding NtrC family response regulator [Desulfobaculum xiamenense]